MVFEENSALYIVLVTLSAVLYVGVGVLIMLRRDSPAIVCRSPILVIIQHWANFSEVVLLFLVMGLSDFDSDDFDKVVTLDSIF